MFIGAGAAGTSVAYYLQKFAEEEGLAVNITVFEKTNHIGGRTITVNAFDDPKERVELGASIFIKDNHIMYNATQMFNLSLTGLSESQAGDYTAIWDGENIVFRSEASSSKWWDAAKLFYKYGLAPYRAIQLVKGAVGTFLRLYEAPHFPFRSLTQRAFELGLLRLTGVTGDQYLRDNNVSLHP
jgi:prenylcysteine oxidase/farnesylcysteine lyase